MIDWTKYRYPADLPRDKFEAIMVKTIDIQTKFCGKKPKGFTAPAWRNSSYQIELLEKLGIEYGMIFVVSFRFLQTSLQMKPGAHMCFRPFIHA